MLAIVFLVLGLACRGHAVILSCLGVLALLCFVSVVVLAFNGASVSDIHACACLTFYGVSLTERWSCGR